VRQPLLALLAKEPAHGYELKLALEQTFGQAYPSPNIGQIYVTLKRLEQDGLVRSQDVAQDSRPNKKVYELTPAGLEQLAAWVTEPMLLPRHGFQLALLGGRFWACGGGSAPGLHPVSSCTSLLP